MHTRRPQKNERPPQPGEDAGRLAPRERQRRRTEPARRRGARERRGGEREPQAARRRPGGHAAARARRAGRPRTRATGHEAQLETAAQARPRARRVLRPLLLLLEPELPGGLQQAAGAAARLRRDALRRTHPGGRRREGRRVRRRCGGLGSLWFIGSAARDPLRGHVGRRDDGRAPRGADARRGHRALSPGFPVRAAHGRRPRARERGAPAAEARLVPGRRGRAGDARITRQGGRRRQRDARRAGEGPENDAAAVRDGPDEGSPRVARRDEHEQRVRRARRRANHFRRASRGTRGGVSFAPRVSPRGRVCTRPTG